MMIPLILKVILLFSNVIQFIKAMYNNLITQVLWSILQMRKLRFTKEKVFLKVSDKKKLGCETYILHTAYVSWFKTIKFGIYKYVYIYTYPYVYIYIYAYIWEWGFFPYMEDFQEDLYLTHFHVSNLKFRIFALRN